MRIETPCFVNRYEICMGHSSDATLQGLQKSLQSLGVESKVLVRKDGQRNISINRKDSKIKFFRQIKHRVCSSMSYKIDVIPSLSLLE